MQIEYFFIFIFILIIIIPSCSAHTISYLIPSLMIRCAPSCTCFLHVFTWYIYVRNGKSEMRNGNAEDWKRQVTSGWKAGVKNIGDRETWRQGQKECFHFSPICPSLTSDSASPPPHIFTLLLLTYPPHFTSSPNSSLPTHSSLSFRQNPDPSCFAAKVPISLKLGDGRNHPPYY